MLKDFQQIWSTAQPADENDSDIELKERDNTIVISIQNEGRSTGCQFSGELIIGI